MSKETVKIYQLGSWYDFSRNDASQWPPFALLEKVQSILSAERDQVVILPTSVEERLVWQRGAQDAICQKYKMEFEAFRGLSSSKLLDCEFSELLQVVAEPDGSKTRGLSHGRPLQWALMDIAAACQFSLHAHPNVELVYCLEGALHEIRLTGDPITKNFPRVDPTAEVPIDVAPKVHGPSTLPPDRPWQFGTLSAGEWLVNEIGSIHKSFTPTNQGCCLLVLWSGDHANIPSKEPSLVTAAVQQVNELCTNCAKSVHSLPSIFVPEVEKKPIAS